MTSGEIRRTGKNNIQSVHNLSFLAATVINDDCD
jgi:hypothetical protein